MEEDLTVQSERVDDTPLLLAHMGKMGVISLLDECFGMHGNWQGLSLGEVAAGWLTHILSEGDHRMNHVQPWAENQLETLSGCLGRPVTGLDFSDDRLSIVLRTLSGDGGWEAFEKALNGNLLRVYELGVKQVRIDTTTCSGYWEVSEDGLFQFGFSKDHRPDQPQVKVVLSTLDPLGMPVATDVVAGQRADDPLYVPAIQRVREGLDVEQLLYIGDAKMAARETRATVAALGDHYLCPLPRTQVSDEQMAAYLEPVWQGEQDLGSIYREKAGEREQVASGYEREVTVSAEVDGEPITWAERHLVVRSLRQARAAETRLQKKLDEAQAALEQLNERGRGKKRYQRVAELQAAAQDIVADYDLRGLLVLTYEETVEEREVRRYGDHPARTEVERDAFLTVAVDEAAVEHKLQQAGWRVYATNAPAISFPLPQAVLAYRNQYIVERGCGRLKGKPLSLTPMYLEREDHVTGLIRLLTIGLRVLTVLEFAVRRRLAQTSEELAGLYAGNPTRTTARPTAERLLEAFEHITLSVIQFPDRCLRHITELSDLQRRILALLGFSAAIYTDLAADSSIPP